MHNRDQTWRGISTAPFGELLEIGVLGGDGVHALVFPCCRILGGWMDAATKERLEVNPTHWRPWQGGPSPQPRPTFWQRWMMLSTSKSRAAQGLKNASEIEPGPDLARKARHRLAGFSAPVPVILKPREMMKMLEARMEGPSEEELTLGGVAPAVRRCHAIVEMALALRDFAPSIELQLDWLLLANEAHLEAEKLARNAQSEHPQNVYVRLLKHHLELAEDLVAASQAVIDQQRSLVEQTEAVGRDPGAARTLLGCFMDAHQGLITRRDNLRRELPTD